MRVLLTGATGFIGGAVAREALRRGFDLTCTHRGQPGSSAARWRTMAELERDQDVFDIVVHAAALRHRHGIAPGAYLRENLALTDAVLQVARRGAARFVDVSSVAVYGWPATLPIDERCPAAPIGEYGQSKVVVEERVRTSGLPWTIVQPSITYGPGDTNGMMDKILRMVARGRFVVPGLGRSRVQLVYVDDLARLIVDAALSPRTLGQRFICTYQDPIEIRELVRLASKTVGRWIPPVGPPVRLLSLGARVFEIAERVGLIKGEPPLTREKLATVTVDRCFRIDHMRSLLGDEPRVGYAEGFARTAAALGLTR